MWMFVDGKGIEILSYIMVIILYGMVKLHLRKTIRSFERSDSATTASQFVRLRTVKAAKSADRKLMFVPLFFVLLRIWGTVRFFIFIHGHNHHSVSDTDIILLYLQAIGDNLQGFVNCILFCFFTPKVWNHIKKINYCRFCHWTSKRIDTSSMEEKLVAELPEH